jgi:hypothetical protein
MGRRSRRAASLEIGRSTWRRHTAISICSEKAATIGFAELLARADTRRVDSVEAPICSLPDLVAMKRSAGRERDRVDLADLESAHGDLPDSSDEVV